MKRPAILDEDVVVVPSRPIAWFVKDFADGWIYFDNNADANLQINATGAISLAGFSASPHATAWDDVRKYVEGLEARLVAVAGPCSLGVGCEQYGVCYADAHGKPEECGKPSFECEALKDARRIADHDKKLWLAAEARIAELEKRLADAERVIEPFSKWIVPDQDPTSVSGWRFGVRPSDDDFRAARAYMEGK